MAHSFDLKDFAPAQAAAPVTRTRRRVLVTGAAGRIGSYFAEHSHHKYDLRLTDISLGDDREAFRAYGELLEGDLDDLDFLKRACAGVDPLVRMAGTPGSSAAWSDLLATSIVGTYHACVAAGAAGSFLPRRSTLSPATRRTSRSRPVNPPTRGISTGNQMFW